MSRNFDRCLLHIFHSGTILLRVLKFPGSYLLHDGKAFLSFLFLFSGAMDHLQAQNTVVEKSQAIDSVLQHYANEYSIVGLSVGVVHQNKSYTFQYGYTDQSKRHPVTDSTMFLVSSITKLFTATAVFQLIEEGKLHTDDKITDLLPEFRMKDVRYRDIRISHLLTHTSGLPWDVILKDSPDDATALPLLLQELQRKKLSFTPGEALSYKTYSNVAFDLLGMVVESQTGMPIQEYVTARILQPLDMQRSTYFYETIDSTALAIPQVVSGNSRRVTRLNQYGRDSERNPVMNGKPLLVESYPVYGEEYEHNGSGNLISNAPELNLWMTELLRIYQDIAYDGVIGRSTLEDMWTIHQTIAGKKTAIGWGWWTYPYEQWGTSVFHVGTNVGFCSILTIFPRHDLGITVLCNGWYAQEAVWHGIADEVAKIFLDENQ